MSIQWGRVLLAAFVMELVLIAIAAPLFKSGAGRVLVYVIPPAALIATFAITVWLGRKINSKFVLHGTLIGIVGTLMYIALTRAQPEPWQYWVAHALKVVGGAAGGMVLAGVRPQGLVLRRALNQGERACRNRLLLGKSQQFPYNCSLPVVCWPRPSGSAGNTKMNLVIAKLHEAQLRKDLPEFRPGDTVRVNVRLKEGEGEKEKERLQAFEGVVISKKGRASGATFTVRRVSFGVGIERIFPLHSPTISSIEVVGKGKVRRARLYYLRNLRGKAARIKRAGREEAPAAAVAVAGTDAKT